MQIKWWLPYRAIVNRMYEEGYLSETIYKKLYEAEYRNPEREYGMIFVNLNKEIFQLLNSVTETNSISNNVIEITIQNFEDGIISENEFIDALNIFGKKPQDFGFNIRIANDDEEMADFFNIK